MKIQKGVCGMIHVAIWRTGDIARAHTRALPPHILEKYIQIDRMGPGKMILAN